MKSVMSNFYHFDMGEKIELKSIPNILRLTWITWV